MKGFLGTYANLSADLNLVIQIMMAAALLAGACLARLKRCRAHGICEATVLILNFFLMAFMMRPSFH